MGVANRRLAAHGWLRVDGGGAVVGGARLPLKDQTCAASRASGSSTSCSSYSGFFLHHHCCLVLDFVLFMVVVVPLDL